MEITPFHVDNNLQIQNDFSQLDLTACVVKIVHNIQAVSNRLECRLETVLSTLTNLREDRVNVGG